jgi:Arm DNA-binding domain
MLQKAPLSTNDDVALMPPGRHRAENETGLYLYVSPDGQTRRWIFRFTSPATKRVTETGLGLWPAVELTDVKSKADDLRKQVAQGICPINARRAQKVSAVTFKEACDGWIETHKPSWRGQSQ